jgi:hypothetical protein
VNWLLGKLLVAWKKHLEKHLGELLGACRMPLWKLLEACRKHLGKLLGAYRKLLGKLLGKHLGKLLGINN